MDLRFLTETELAHAFGPHRLRHAYGLLFCGDRAWCCDERIAAYEGETFLGAVTLAPHGEERSGEPTIVGLWVVPDARSRGVGRALLEAAIQRMLERGLTPIRIDALNTKVSRIIASLPEELRLHLEVVETIACDALLDP